MRAWFVLSLPLSVACSGGGVRSGSLPEAADFLPMTTDSAEPASSMVVDGDTVELGDGEQPRLVLRCEAGRLGAYLVVGTPPDMESGQVDDQAVVVRLDSAPPC